MLTAAASHIALPNQFNADASAKDVAEAIVQDGYAIINNAIDSPLRQRLKDDLAPYIESTEFGVEDFWGHKTKRFGALIAKSTAACDMVVHPLVLGVADEVLLEYCASYWLNYTGLMYLAPGERAQSLHRDTNLWPFRNPCPPLTLATMWAVDDFSYENGATLVVPGSHRWDDSRQPRPDEVFSAEMPAGSVLLYSGNVIHGGGENQSESYRYGVALHYVLGWLRQEETQLLAVSKEQTLALPEKIQRLLGYSLGAGSLGMVDHRDPWEVLTGKRVDKPKALSSPELDANEEAMKRLSVVDASPGGRTRIDPTFSS